MKRYMLYLVLGAILLPTAVFSEEHMPAGEMGRQMELHAMKLKMAQQENEVRFKEEMAKLELEQRRLAIDRERRALDYRRHKRAMCPIFVICFIVVHILVATWVYTDIRRRNCGSGIWIVIALLAGLLGALVYAVVRLGDNNTKTRK